MNPPLLIVGEAQGEAEARLGSSFVGPSGAALLKMLHEAHILALNPADYADINAYFADSNPAHLERIWHHHPEVRRTNVFNLHPPGNDLLELCGPKSSAISGYPLLAKSKYLRAEFEPELDRLASEILALNPNLILCLGNTPLWALAGRTGIKNWRGTTLLSTHTVADYKLLCTYHPAAVLRGWELRPQVIADLHKAARELHFSELRRRPHDIYIEPTVADIKAYILQTIHTRKHVPLSVDIETSGSRITCLGLGYSDVALVIPFDDDRAKSGNYWATAEDERTVWELVRGVLGNPTIPKLFQNGLYDIAFLWRSMKIKVLGATHDTMLLHHALQPESIKGLGFLGSIYSDEGAWKQMGKRSKTIKRDS